ncbi:hypothetical protein [Zavarzinella formosa]|uniref:hypothetical protein n=1 Tax=Zavarzinella formosa TaxID=360055 RepID=UPI0012FAB5BE|nr:hypothetical protein [Zavarzinella formosa]
MAKVTLTEYECRKNLLPDVCMECGEPAGDRVRRKFSWYPPWTTALRYMCPPVGAIVRLTLLKFMDVRAPMCEDHKKHWLKIGLRALISFGILIIFELVCFGLISAFAHGEHEGEIIGLGCGVGVFAFIAWRIFLVVLRSRMIKPTEITLGNITLTNIHPDFVQALEEDRAADEEYHNRSKRKRSPSKNFRDRDDDRPPPKKKKNDSWHDDE